MHLKHLLTLALLGTLHADPLVTSWYTEKSGQFARIYETTADETAQNAVTTWSQGQGSQNSPTYAGVHEISSTATDVYIRSTNLGFHVMGPWYLDEAKTNIFPNYPTNSAVLYRFPRTPSIPGTKTTTSAGVIGYFVDGIAMFDSADTFSYDTSGGGDQTPGNALNGDGIWNRDAYINESVTFDAANAHQAGANHHYHANPPALRHLLGDSVDYNATNNTYTENFNGNHSPIIGWFRDGLPIYGPYGYDDPEDPFSSVRRMISGYQKRDGTNGSTNLNSTGRTTVPDWLVRNNANYTANTISASFYGPNVSATYVLGHYIEDYAYKGDLSLDLGTDFDLNEYNVRWCKTPEFPAGTWAYFTNIEADGTPAFPYNTSGYYYGTPSGSAEATIPGTATIHFQGGPETTDSAAASHDSGSGDVTITWSVVEGGVYQVTSSTDLETFTKQGDEFTATSILMETTEAAGIAKFFNLERIGITAFDDTGFDYDNSIIISGGGGGSGDFTATFNTAGSPPFPPAGIPPTSVTIGGIPATYVSHAVQGQIAITFDDSLLLSGNHSVQVQFDIPPTPFTSTNQYFKP